MSRMRTIRRRCKLRVILSTIALAGTISTPVTTASGQASAAALFCQTELFGRRYRLDDSQGLAAYTRALEAAMGETEQHAKPVGANVDRDNKSRIYVSITAARANAKAPKSRVDKKMRRSMEEAHAVAVALAVAVGPERQRLLSDLYIMAGGIRASTMRLLPGNMDVFSALLQEGPLRHPPVGLGRNGPATDVDDATGDPLWASTYWTRRDSIAEADLYHGFDRIRLPGLEGETCTYLGPKSGLGVHGGFEISCGRCKKAKIKFGKQYSQPFAQRIFWAMGYHTVPADYVPMVKVRWDERILTEYNSRKDEQFSVKLFGLIAVHTEHLQHYLDPFEPISEVIMVDEEGKEVSVKPDPDWKGFKALLFKNPVGRPETVPGNLNKAFASRIKYLVYRHVSLQLKNDTEEEDEVVLGNWDWNGEGSPQLRETRGVAFLDGWLNGYDPSVANNRLTMIHKDGGRTFKRYISDVGVCLGRADDAARMREQDPNAFPWSFTRPTRPGETCIPFDGSYHPIKRNRAFEAADIEDARWMARILAQFTEAQILEGLVASGMPSAYVRLYYNKLATRRNRALEDLGLHYPPLKLMDTNREFDYDPRQQGPISITTRQGETVTAPDEGWTVVKGRILLRPVDER